MRISLLLGVFLFTTSVSAKDTDTHIKLRDSAPAKGEFLVDTRMVSPAQKAASLPVSSVAPPVSNDLPRIPSDNDMPSTTGPGTGTPAPVIATMAQAKAAGIDPLGEFSTPKVASPQPPAALSKMTWDSFVADSKVFLKKLGKSLKAEGVFSLISEYGIHIFSFVVGCVLAWLLANIRRRYFLTK